MNELFKQLKEMGGRGEVYIVGGWLRDRLLGRKNRDLDLAVPGDPRVFARKTAKKLKGTLIVLDEENRIYRVVLKNNPYFAYLDFARMKGPDIRSDLAKRDFTITSMALPLPERGKIELSKLIDPFGGRADLKRSLVRMTSPAVFKDDPLRLLRAFRLAAELDFRLEPSTRRMIALRSALIRNSAPERIREELFKILSRDCSSVWVREMERTKLLERIIPEITPMKSSARRFYFHPLGLWQHAIETLISLEVLLAHLDRYFPRYQKKIEEHLDTALSSGISRRSLLKLVCLLHDVAKPACAARVEKRMRFLGHEEKGAALAGEILRRLRLSNKEIRIAKSLIASHMRPVSLSQAGVLTSRAAFRLFRDMGSDVPDLLLLALSDWHSYKRLKTRRPAGLRKQEATLRELIRRFFAEKEKPSAPRLIDGNALMKALRLSPGPLIGKLLELVGEAQALGKIATQKEALDLARKQLTLLKKKYTIT
ncbi:MAG: CCA tRNA nucleotidyltransferase [Endomicrobiales bacterium]